MTDTITLPRSVIEQVLETLNASKPYDSDIAEDWSSHIAARRALRAALEQPNHTAQHLNMVPEGWKPVPVEPTRGMLDAAHKDLVRDAEIDVMLKGIHSAMLAAAPQPPAVKDSLTTRPQVEQEPIAYEVVSKTGDYCLFRSTAVKKGDKVYAQPQPRQPLTPEAVNDLWIKHARSGAYIHAFARAIERAHGIGGEQ